MSKTKKKRNKKHQPEKKKKSNKKTIIITVCVACAAALIVAGAIIADRLTNVKYADFVGKAFSSQSAYDSKGKEVDLRDVYVNAERYDTYTGSLGFKEDSTFSMWMGPGPDDGSHDGTFTYNMGDSVINGEFKNGNKIKFKIVRDKNGDIKRIEAPYGEYTIYFS
ncbi:MAG: hypothetical protein IJ932_00310 [Ruminococcus sp.]|nr:hypothetical protein [Ruminococcus sp.]